MSVENLLIVLNLPFPLPWVTAPRVCVALENYDACVFCELLCLSENEFRAILIRTEMHTT